MNAVWHCPLCGHENVDHHANERERLHVAYCDDPADEGCGEGPFVIRTVIHQDAYRVQGQGYPLVSDQ